jgi:hypothetical protein
MDRTSKSRIIVTMKHLIAVALTLVTLAPASALAETRWAVIVSGASGGEKYAEQMRGWREGLRTAMVSRYGFKPEHVRLLVDESVATGEKGSAENVRKVFAEIKKAGSNDDFVLVVLLGHGTYDGDVAKFNLVGPDLTAKDWTGILAGVQGRLAVVNTTEASYPFLESLTAKGRVVITATDSGAQKYATVFPEYFAKALNDPGADLDKNGKTSIWEVFAAASGAVARHFTERAQLTTERAVLSDTGEKVGVQASATGPQGTLSRSLFLDRDVVAENASPEVQALIARRRALETEAEAHIQKKSAADPAAWAAEFERLMIELARVSREIRQRS